MEIRGNFSCMIVIFQSLSQENHDFEFRICSKSKPWCLVLISYLLAERRNSPGIEGLNLSNFDRSMAPETEIKEFRCGFLSFLD